MSIAQQLALNFRVNNVFLPMDVISIIKDFAFQDKVVAATKKQKKNLITDFTTAIYSRAYPSTFVNDTTEDWKFLSSDFTANVEGTNCSVCGNYLIAFSHKILCRCEHQNHNFELDGDIMDDHVFEDPDADELWLDYNV
jgi:hypothetical protein